MLKSSLEFIQYSSSHVKGLCETMFVSSKGQVWSGQVIQEDKKDKKDKKDK